MSTASLDPNMNVTAISNIVKAVTPTAIRLTGIPFTTLPSSPRLRRLINSDASPTTTDATTKKMIKPTSTPVN